MWRATHLKHFPIWYNTAQFKTTANYNLNNTNIVNLIPLWQCQLKLHIIILIKVEFKDELLYSIAFDFTRPNKVDTVYLNNIAVKLVWWADIKVKKQN